MSLAGNLSDLSLPELLQVVALSRKTGALEICSEGGVAWLGLRDGGIVRVALEGGDLDRDTILEKAGLTEGGDSDVAAAMLWDAAVQAILGIFDWSEGEFTFEPLDDPALQWRGPQGILLPSPLSPEFLALEGARIEDENAATQNELRFTGEDDAGESASEPESEPDFEAEPEPEPEPEPVTEIAPEIEPPPDDPEPPELDAIPAQAVEDDTPVRLRAIEEARREAKTLPEPRLAVPDPDATVVQREPFEISTRTAAPFALKLPTSLICIDPDLPLLERLKAGLADQPVRVHIFQSANDALARFKQYVIRGEVPAVVLGSGVEDPLDARQGLGWRRFAGRLLAIAPRMRIVIVSRPGESVAAPGLAVVRRPEPRAAAGDVEAFLRSVREQLGGSA
jgi:outer membrane biosynthesis protein TonB